MSGDLTHVQGPMVTNDFVENMKFLSVSSSWDSYADVIKQLHLQLKCSIPNGFKENKPFAFSIVNHFHQIVPILDTILSNDDEDNHDAFLQTKSFLKTLANAFKEICLFDLFVTIKAIDKLQPMFRNNIILLKEKYFTDNHIYDDLINCLLSFVAYSSLFIPVKEEEIPANLLTYLLTYAKKYWKCRHREDTMKNILGMIKAFSKKPALVPMIIHAQWPHACVEWLANPNVATSSRPSYVVDHYIYLILQKLARHTIAVQVLNQLNCLKALDENEEQMEKDHTESENNILGLLHCMIYVLLMEADDIKQLSLLTDTRMCQALNQLVLYTVQASRTEFFCYQCFHISEILSVLSKLFVNDDILRKCVDGNNQLFECLCELTIHFNNITSNIDRIHVPTDVETLLTSTNLLWSISFHQCYQEKFHSNSILMNTLSNLVSSSSLYVCTPNKSIPRDICSLKKAAEGILWNLKSSSQSISKTPNVQSEQQPLAMISYSHSDSIFCREFVEHLSAHVPVWVDYKQAHDTVAHSDDLWEEIARAMEMATVIVLIVSKEYYDSKSCRQELSYAADTLKKRIVPIYAPNQQYRASGWLGIRIAGQKYIHFGRKLFADAIKELASIVVTDVKKVVRSVLALPPPLPEPKPEPTSYQMTPEKIPETESKLLTLEDWTSKDIRKWFDDNQIHADLIKLYADQIQTGTALIIYARHVKLFYRNEYIRIFTKYQQIFPDKTLDTFDFISFVDALYHFRAEYDPNSLMEDRLERSNEKQLPYKTKSLEDGMAWL